MHCTYTVRTHRDISLILLASIKIIFKGTCWRWVEKRRIPDQLVITTVTKYTTDYTYDAPGIKTTASLGILPVEASLKLRTSYVDILCVHFLRAI